MLTRIQLSALLAIAAVIWAVALIFQGVAVSWTWLRPFSIVLGALVLILALVEKWAWQFRFVQPWLVHMPDIRGTWRAELHPTNADPQLVSGYMVIRQTLSSVSLRLLTQESESEILAARVTKAGDGRFSVAGIYRNTPRLSMRDQSPVHHGAILLTVQGEPVVSLDGQYWTDRGSQGEIRLSQRSRTLVHSFDEATTINEAK